MKVPEKLSRMVNKCGLKLNKYSPEILVVAGVTGTVVAAVMACKATTKAHEVTDKLLETKEEIDKVVELSQEREDVEYTEKDHKKDLTIAYAQAAVGFAKVYGPAIAVGVLSITSILAGNHILRKRNIALAAAYTAVDTSFKNYRNRVIERFGKELDHELRYNVKAQEFEKTVVDEKTGKEKVVKETVNVVDELDEYSEYARFFDDGCTGWTKDPEANLAFLRDQQLFATDRLRIKGHLFLNEVYDMLGIPRSKAGQMVGWIYDEKHPNGDNQVSFGIYDSNKPKTRDFINGYERTVLLDFNVDGPIVNLI